METKLGRLLRVYQALTFRANSWMVNKPISGPKKLHVSLLEPLLVLLLWKLRKIFKWKYTTTLKIKLKGILREKSDVVNSENAEEDKIKLGAPGWKERYYEDKFSAKTPEELQAIRRDVVLRYTEGLCWVMHYYYEGVCSWQWFYPYHYAPFASDLEDLGHLTISFELGSPFKPFNQLLGVFPAASSHALPEHYRKLMTDPNSPIIDFYPTDFEVDMNGKRFAWQGIAKLPFIDEARLLAEVSKVEHTLTEEEARRNSMMFDMLFVALSHTLSPYIFSLNDRCKQLTNEERAEIMEQIDPGASGGMNGYISLCAGDPCPPIFRSPVQGMEDIMDNQVICALYRLPDAHEHIARPPAGVKLPKKTVTLGDLKPEPTLWHEDSGRKPWENGRNSHNRHNNPPGAISGRQLGEAAHRLVVNSLQVKTDLNGYGHQVYDPRPPYGPTSPSFQNNRPYNHNRSRTGQPRPGYPAAAHNPGSHHRPSNFNYDHSHGQPPYPSPNNPYSRSHPQTGLPVGPTHGYYQQGGAHQNGHVYPRAPPPMMQRPLGQQAGVHFYPQQGGGHTSSNGNYSTGASYQHHQSGGLTPRPNQNGGRGGGYGRPPQQGGNQFTALNRGGGSRRPPPPGHQH